MDATHSLSGTTLMALPGTVGTREQQVCCEPLGLTGNPLICDFGS